MCVELADEVLRDANAEKQQMVTARYLTNYEAVSRFTHAFEAMLKGKTEEAVLDGNEFLGGVSFA